jgi:hypothetical protein
MSSKNEVVFVVVKLSIFCLIIINLSEMKVSELLFLIFCITTLVRAADKE